jgi:hypothetical protein
VTAAETHARVRSSRLALWLDRELVACTALTAALASALLAFGPAPGDAAVHLYRTFLVRHGALLWDNYWYAGHYPLASYSLLYYLPAAVIGNLPLVLAAAVLSTLFFASIARREWGDNSTWSSRAFGVCAAAPLFTGLYSYSLGFAAALGAAWALQRKRAVLALVFAAVTLGFSPLAFAFLCLLLLAAVAVRRRLTPAVVGFGAGVGVLAGFELLVLRIFPSAGVYPFYTANLAGCLGVSVLGVLLARRAPNGQLLTAFFALWGASSVFFWAVPSSVGGNWTRLGEFSFPLMLLAASLARFRPRGLVILALAGALAYTLVPNLMLIPYRLDNRPAAGRFWQPALSFLANHARTGYRVEVVPTAAHWESYWLPSAGYALARGWYRQLDMVDNPVLYAKGLDAVTYRNWLRQQAVEYVLLPSTRLDPDGGPREAHVLRSRDSGLSVAYRDRRWTIYRLPQPTPLITGPGPARVDAFGHTRIVGTVSQPGRYLLRAHYIPFWEADKSVCVERGPNRMSWLNVYAPGRFSLSVAPAGEAILLAATVEQRHSCRKVVTRAPERGRLPRA